MIRYIACSFPLHERYATRSFSYKYIHHIHLCIFTSFFDICTGWFDLVLAFEHSSHFWTRFASHQHFSGRSQEKDKSQELVYLLGTRDSGLQ